jgi:hypothetical protein
VCFPEILVISGRVGLTASNLHTHYGKENESLFNKITLLIWFLKEYFIKAIKY